MGHEDTENDLWNDVKNSLFYTERIVVYGNVNGI